MGGRFDMSMELLQALADAEMPLEIVNPAFHDRLKVLHAAGHIICSFPPTGTTQPAQVHMVTALGHKALRHFGRAAAAIPRGPDGPDESACGSASPMAPIHSP